MQSMPTPHEIPDVLFCMQCTPQRPCEWLSDPQKAHNQALYVLRLLSTRRGPTDPPACLGMGGGGVLRRPHVWALSRGLSSWQSGRVGTVVLVWWDSLAGSALVTTLLPALPCNHYLLTGHGLEVGGRSTVP